MGPKILQPTHDNLNKVCEMVKKIQFAMMTTEDEKGNLKSRPMAIQDVSCSPDGSTCLLWLYTYAQSSKISQLQQHGLKCCLALADTSKQNYVSLTGECAITQDKSDIEKHWSTSLNAWFPQGKDTPGITVIKFTTHEVEYWDSTSAPVANLISFVKSTLKGEVAHPGEHGLLKTEHKQTYSQEDAKTKV